MQLKLQWFGPQIWVSVSVTFQTEKVQTGLPFPWTMFPVLACCINPVLLPLGSVPLRLLKYWHLHVIVFFLLFPGSIKKPVFPLTHLYLSCLSSPSWEGKLNAHDEVIPVCWHLLLQITYIKTNSQCFWGSVQAMLPLESTFWSLSFECMLLSDFCSNSCHCVCLCGSQCSWKHVFRK